MLKLKGNWGDDNISSTDWWNFWIQNCHNSFLISDNCFISWGNKTDSISGIHNSNDAKIDITVRISEIDDNNEDFPSEQ